jgi:8-oxo-dGTP pyrophosphatase MutT (NUDIX family)
VPSLPAHTHCHRCGVAYADATVWPRVCTGCGGSTWKNPLPVAVALTPVVDGGLVVGLLGIYRALGPTGRAFPGGYIDAQDRPTDAPSGWRSETWYEAIARELFEETGVVTPTEEVRLFSVASAPDGTIMIFATTAPITKAEADAIGASDETTGAFVLRPSRVDTLVFQRHRDAARQYFELLAEQQAPRVSRSAVQSQQQRRSRRRRR